MVSNIRNGKSNAVVKNVTKVYTLPSIVTSCHMLINKCMCSTVESYTINVWTNNQNTFV